MQKSTFEHKVQFTIAYKGLTNTDGFSAISYLGNGIIVAGKRSWETYGGKCLYRSTDYGNSWTALANPISPEPTGAHVYYFDHNGPIVVCGTGDNGDCCVMLSSDYGATWSNVLTSIEIHNLTDGQPIRSMFSPVYMGNNRWLFAMKNSFINPTDSTIYFLESTDNAATWHSFQTRGLRSGARRVMKTSDGKLLLVGITAEKGLYRSEDDGYNWERIASWQSFSGIADMGNGVYLAGTYAFGNGEVLVSIYKSCDSGATWTENLTVPVSTSLGYFRTIVNIAPDTAIAFACSSELSLMDRQACAYLTRDNGETWTCLGNPYTDATGGRNAIYDYAMLENGNILLASQPDTDILRMYIADC